MTIKEYDLSEGIVSDEKLGKWFGEAGFGTATIITRENIDGVAVIHVVNSRYDMQINSRCNLITCMGVDIGADTWGVVHPENEVQLMEELFNSQWHDLKKELPDEGQRIIVKISVNIIDCFYHGTGIESWIGYVPMEEIIGWMSLDNVEI